MAVLKALKVRAIPVFLERRLDSKYSTNILLCDYLDEYPNSRKEIEGQLEEESILLWIESINDKLHPKALRMISFYIRDLITGLRKAIKDDANLSIELVALDLSKRLDEEMSKRFKQDNIIPSNFTPTVNVNLFKAENWEGLAEDLLIQIVSLLI